jgi:HlyD family secretion protein
MKDSNQENEFIKQALRRGKLPLAALFMATFATATVWPKPAPPPAVPLGGAPSTYTGAGDHSGVIAGLGFVEPAGRVLTLATELPGVIRAVHAAVGAEVKTGAPLVELDQRESDARIVSLERQLSTARIELEEAKESDERLRKISLDSTARAVSIDESARRRFAVRKTEARVHEIEAAIAEARVTKERLILTSPIDGTLLDIEARIGEYAVPSQGVSSPKAALVRIADLRGLYVRAQFDEEFAGRLLRLRNGSAAHGVVRTLATADGSGIKSTREIPLALERIEPRADTKVSTSPGDPRVDTRVVEGVFRVEPASNAKLLVGQRVDVFIETD